MAETVTMAVISSTFTEANRTSLWETKYIIELSDFVEDFGVILNKVTRLSPHEGENDQIRPSSKTILIIM